MNNPRFVVWNYEHGFPTFWHPSLETAVAEAERLAKQCHGEAFNVLAPVGVAVVTKPEIFRPLPNLEQFLRGLAQRDDVPF